MLNTIRQQSSVRLAAVVAVLVVWFVVSNRCVLAGLAPEKPAAAAAAAEIHRCCDRPAPGDEKAPEEKPLCCQSIAFPIPDNGSVPPPLLLTLILPEWNEEIHEVLATAAKVYSPPGRSPPPSVRTFVELVLHRSLRSHAPPVFS